MYMQSLPFELCGKLDDKVTIKKGPNLVEMLIITLLFQC